MDAQTKSIWKKRVAVAPYTLVRLIFWVETFRPTILRNFGNLLPNPMGRFMDLVSCNIPPTKRIGRGVF